MYIYNVRIYESILFKLDITNWYSIVYCIIYFVICFYFICLETDFCCLRILEYVWIISIVTFFILISI